jgi:site-specific recombinase XerD
MTPSRDPSIPIAPLVQSFFEGHLAGERGLSPNTVLAYRDCLKLFLAFLSRRLGKPAQELRAADFDEGGVLAFLDHLQRERGNSTRSRNARLQALRSFFGFLALRRPEDLDRCRRICAIPAKRAPAPANAIDYLEGDEMRSLLDAVDQDSAQGCRDYALLLLLYNTGARVSEATGLEIDDLRLQAPLQVRLRGKGRKERTCPLWPETADALKRCLGRRRPASPDDRRIFLNAQGLPLTRFGIRWIVQKHAEKARLGCPSLRRKKVSPHTLRHTTAMHLLQSGNELTVVKSWLGHADISTTHAYVEIDLEMKRKALEACDPPKGAQKDARWLRPDILLWLHQLSRTGGIMCRHQGKNSLLGRTAPMRFT